MCNRRCLYLDFKLARMCRWTSRFRKFPSGNRCGFVQTLGDNFYRMTKPVTVLERNDAQLFHLDRLSCSSFVRLCANVGIERNRCTGGGQLLA